MLKFQNNNTTFIATFEDFILTVYVVIDSFLLTVCKFGRARYCRSFRSYGTDYGKCPSNLNNFYF